MMINQDILRYYDHVGRPTNRTTTKEALKDPKKAVILGICSLIVLENLIVLLAVWKNHKFHNRMYFFIANLALCDLLAGVAYVVNLMMSGDMTFHLSITAWFVREGSMFVALSASIFSLLAIAIERHLTMIKMRPYDANKKYRVFLLIGTCWLIAVTLGALPILGWNCLGKLPECSTTLPLYSKNYVAFCITIFISLLLAISVLYARIYILVKTTSSKVTKHSNSEHSMALLRTVSIVVGVFIACWTPLFVLFLIDVACQGGAKSCPILLEADWFIALAALNSALNPVIYTLASREMRRAFYRLLCGCVVKEDGVGSKQNTDPNKSKTSSNSQREAEPDGPENVNAQNQPADS